MRENTILVTGASRGIGRSIAKAFADDQSTLILAARRAENLDTLVDELTAAGVSATAAGADLADASSVDRFCRETLASQRVDVLVNNAGIAESAKLSETDDDLWERHLDVNLTAAFKLCRAVLPGMQRRGFGRIINIASTAGKVGYKYTAAYCASKHGLIGLTRALALETATDGVTVNAICPGFVETDIARSAIQNIAGKTGKGEASARRWLAAQSPQNRLIQPEEVASLALMLASEGAGGINGQAINLDGGSVFY